MKKTLKIIILLVIIVACVFVIYKQVNAQIPTGTDPSQTGVTNTIREKLRASTPSKPQVQNNIEAKNELQSRLMAERVSTTVERRNIVQNMKIQAFKIRHNTLIRQIRLSLKNLEQVTSRIVARIEKAETNGRDMTKAKVSLIIAREKLSLAEQAIKDLSNYDPTSVSNASTTSNEDAIDLVKPRQIADEAIKAIKVAKDVLIDVVREIAHAMGQTRNISDDDSASSTQE